MRFSYFAAIALVVTCGLTVSPLVRGEGMVPSEVLTRTFCIRAGAKSGTGFTIDVDGRQYLITARHILQQSPVPSEVFVLRGSEWIKLPFRAVVVEPAKVDIAVLALPQQISAAGPVRVGVAGSFLSQEVFFLGYPFGLTVDGRALNNGFPFPLAKHGIIAGLSFGDDPYIIDAINNPGFSGGPVMRMDSGNKPVIIAVVSGYRAVAEPVYQGSSETSLSVQANTGLMAAYPIDSALAAIAKNPIGAPLRPTPTPAP